MNIFYTEVDKNLQEELNARGRTGFQDRSSNAIDFMVGKIANVRIIAYEGNDSKSGIVKNPQAILGGAQLQSGRYLPTSQDGFLTERKYTETEINFYDEADVARNIKNLTTAKYDKNVIAGNAYLKKTQTLDRSKRIGPYITSLEIAIGDHSMGLLNKATINISIPNVERDLDDIEDVYFRPGRYISVDIVHPDSVIVSNSLTGGYLTSGSLPNKDRIKELYPDWNIDEFLKRISKMNQFLFEGLITSFDFSYTSDGTVDATLSVTGTSNVYTDISMYLSGDDKKKQEATPSSTTENFNLQPAVNTTPPIFNGLPVFGNIQTTKEIEFYELISNRVEYLKGKFLNASEATSKFEQLLLPFTLDDKPSKATDHFFLVGQQYLPKIDIQTQITLEKIEYKFTGSTKRRLLEYSNYQGYITDATASLSRAKTLNISQTEFINRINKVLAKPYTTETPDSNNLTAFSTIKDELWNANLLTNKEKTTFENDLVKANETQRREQETIAKRNEGKLADANKFNTEASSNNNRYITLGALIHVLNTYIIKNIKGSAKSAEIIHSDSATFSNYYPSLVSTNPEQILFLPKDPSQLEDMNSYTNLAGVVNGNGLIYYKDIVKQITANGLTPDALSKAGWQPWPGVYEKQGAITKMYPSRIFINLETIESITKTLTEQKTFTVKQFIARISEIVARCSGNSIDLKLVSYPDDPVKLILADTKYTKSKSERVLAYSVPMFANHPNGSIVREFSFSAKLPENAKNLSYVLNQGDDVTEDQIAPFMNFMYNSKNPDKINEISKTYKEKFTENLKRLTQAKINYGLSPGLDERRGALYKAITDYIKYPTDNIRSSQQLTAPMFPFDVSFTIDGINGLRYGDVLTFDALPFKYRVNTVFSIIGITHNVSTDGEWTTAVRCIMRPSIE